MKKLYILLAIITLFALVAIGLTAFHTKAHCYYNGNGMSVSGCTDETANNCPSAFAISGDVVGVKTYIFCPWTTKSYITGYVGTGLTLLFTGLVCFIRKDSSSRNLIFTLVGMILAALLAACGCMAYDIKKSFDSYHESDRPDGWSELPATYIANVAINFVLMPTVIWTAVKSKHHK